MHENNSEFPRADEEEMPPEEERFIEKLIERAYQACERPQALEAQRMNVAKHETDDAAETASGKEGKITIKSSRSLSPKEHIQEARKAYERTLMDKETLPELISYNESEYHFNDPENQLYIDKVGPEFTGEITSIEEEEEKARAKHESDSNENSSS